MNIQRARTTAMYVACAGMLVLGPVAAPPHLIGVAWADDEDSGPAPAPDEASTGGAEAPVQAPQELLPAEMPSDVVPDEAAAQPVAPAPVPSGTTHAPGEATTTAPAGVAAAVLVPGMDPAFLTINPDGSLVYHGTTAVGVDTPGWNVYLGEDGLDMLHGPVGPAVAAPNPAIPPAEAEADLSS